MHHDHDFQRAAMDKRKTYHSLDIDIFSNEPQITCKELQSRRFPSLELYGLVYFVNVSRGFH